MPTRYGNNIQVLETKINLPVINPKTIQRDRLNEKFVSNLDKKLILFKSPAGFGKTTVLSHCFTDKRYPVSWFTIDAFDDHQEYFFNYLCSSIRIASPEIKDDLDDLLNTSFDHPFHVLIERLIDTLSKLENELYIVFDDFYFIKNEEILKALSFFIDRSYSNVHFIILSRGDIQLDVVSKLRLNQQIYEFSKDELRFNEEETSQFLEERFQEKISFESLSKIQGKIEGWAAGLQLACIRLKTGGKNLNKNLELFLEQDTNVTFYLNEVLNNLSKNLRKEVLRLAILQEFNFEIIEPYLNRTDGNKLIEKLRKLSLFLNQSENGWYRFDNIFRDFLLEVLNTKYTNSIPAMHSIAGKWFVGQKLFDKAIYHFGQIKDYNAIADIIEEEGSRMMFEGRLALLGNWISILPKETLLNRPPLYINFLWLLAVTNQLEELQKQLKAFEIFIESHQDEIPKEINSVAYLNIIKAIVCIQKGNFKNTIKMSEEALQQLDPKNLVVKVVVHGNIGMAALNLGKLDLAIDELTKSLDCAKIVGNKFWQSACGFLLGQAYSWKGDLHEANKIFDQIFDWNKKDKHRNLPALSMAYIGQGQIYLQWNKIDKAYECLMEGLKLGRRLHNDETKIICYVNLSGIYLIRNEEENFKYSIKQALKIGNESEVERLKYTSKVMDALIALRRQEWDRIEEYKRLFGVIDLSKYPLLKDNIDIFHVHYHWIKDNIDNALAYLDEIEISLEANYKYRLALESRVYKALILFDSGKKDLAFDYLNEVIEKAASAYLVRVFLAKGPKIFDLLKAFYNHRVDKVSYDLLNFLTELIQASEKEFDLALQVKQDEKSLPLEYLVDPLTSREFDVLKELGLGLKNKEIADKLFISVGTVKTHVLKIYGKLEVRNRTEAINKAKDLGLI